MDKGSLYDDDNIVVWYSCCASPREVNGKQTGWESCTILPVESPQRSTSNGDDGVYKKSGRCDGDIFFFFLVDTRL